jgi:hypothetical protein
MGSAEHVIFFDLIFTVLLVAFGTALAPSTNSFVALQSLPQPQLAPLPNFQPSSWNPLSGIVQATAYIGWAIINLPVIIAYITIEVILFANVVLSLVFSPTFKSQGVPFLGFVFLGLQVFVLWEVLRTLRGSAAGI